MTRCWRARTRAKWCRSRSLLGATASRLGDETPVSSVRVLPVARDKGVTVELLGQLPGEYRDAVGEILIDEATIATALDRLAREVSTAYAGRDLLIVGVLKGAVFTVTDLLRRLTIPAKVDFMAVSSYGSSTTSSGVVRIMKDLDTEIEGRDVLIVEDIVDSGLTLNYLMKNLSSRKPASVEVLTLLTKPSRREVDVKVAFVGLDVFVVGYGLDYDEQFRGIPHVVALKPSVYGG